MADPMRIRAQAADGKATVRVLMAHEMETGQRKDAAGAVIPAWYIQEVTAQLNGKGEPPRSHAWVIGFAGPEGGEPTIAIAVIVEGQQGASEQTGGRLAAPIAQAVLAAYLQGG